MCLLTFTSIKLAILVKLFERNCPMYFQSKYKDILYNLSTINTPHRYSHI